MRGLATCLSRNRWHSVQMRSSEEGQLLPSLNFKQQSGGSTGGLVLRLPGPPVPPKMVTHTTLLTVLFPMKFNQFRGVMFATGVST